MIGERAPEDAFWRMDTAPLDLSGLHRAPDGAARVRWEQPATSPAGGRDWMPWLRRALVAACVVLLIGAVPVVLALPAVGRSLPSQAASAAPGNATPSVPDTGWQGLELSNGWFATGDGARYRVRDGVCYLQIHVTVRGGTWPAYSEIGVLPASAAPAWNLGFSALRGGQPFGEAGVYNTGRILIDPPSNAPGADIVVSGSFPVG